MHRVPYGLGPFLSHFLNGLGYLTSQGDRLGLPACPRSSLESSLRTKTPLHASCLTLRWPVLCLFGDPVHMGRHGSRSVPYEGE